jgi:GntR family transcriptional regulator/MocR family aminotransferase
LSEAAIARAADRRNITASPIARFSLAPVSVNGLVLGFGGIRPQEIDAGVVVLAEILEQHLAR